MGEDLDGLRLRTKVLEKGKVRNKILLDIGTGPLGIIAARDFNCEVTSIDISEEKLQEFKEQAEKEGISGIRFENEDATHLSYVDDSFDVVVCYCALHHINPGEREDFIHEIFRVTKKKLVLAEFNTAGFEKTHSDGEYKIVDLSWLESELKALGRIEKHEEEFMNIYICQK